MSKPLDELLQPGNRLKIDYGPDNRATKIIHIRAIVDGQYIVYRHWLKSKRRWHYCIEWVYQFEMFYGDGRLKYHGRSSYIQGVASNEVQFITLSN